MTELKCILCKKVRKTEQGMFNHLKKEHAETMRGHYNIVDNFSCEEGSELWKQLSSVDDPTEAKTP
jgi:hypothetical protein